MENSEIIKAIELLSEKLGKTSTQIFGYYVKNAKMYRYYFIFQLLFSLALLLTGLYLFGEANTSSITNEINPNMFVFVGILIIILIGFALFLGVIMRFTEFINAWVNPEYEAMEDILGSLKND